MTNWPDVFNRNFSLASKGEIELIMFHHYMKKKKSEHTGQDGRVEYAAISDYSISKALGILSSGCGTCG